MFVFVILTSFIAIHMSSGSDFMETEIPASTFPPTNSTIHTTRHSSNHTTRHSSNLSTTHTPSTTVFPTHTTPIVPPTTTARPEDVYIVKKNGIVCIILREDITISVKKNDIQLATYSGIRGHVANGNCGHDIQGLLITYNEGINVVFEFIELNGTYYVGAIVVAFNLSSIVNATEKTDVVVIKTNLTSYSNVNGQAFTCNAGIRMSTNVSDYFIDIWISKIEIQAFSKSNSTSFNTNGAVNCEIDNLSNLIPIIVGSVLAGIIIIVLIAYLISRRQRRSGYESV